MDPTTHAAQAAIEKAFGDVCNAKSWTPWRFNPAKGTKPPCDENARVSDGWRDRLRTFSACVALLTAPAFPCSIMPGSGIGHPNAGLGLVDATGIDLDDCFLADGSLHDQAQVVLDLLPNAYVERSPSGAGLKLFCKVDPPSWLEIKFGRPKGLPVDQPWQPTAKRKEPNYFTVTGNVYRDGSATLDGTEAVAQAERLFRVAADSQTVSKPRGSAALPPDGAVVNFNQDDWMRDRAFSHAMRGLQYEDVLKQMRVDAARCPAKTTPWTEADLRRHAKSACEAAAARGAKLEGLPARAAVTDFWTYLPSHVYIYVPTRETWPASSVNASVPSVKIGEKEDGSPKWQKAADWLDANRAVEQMTWHPGAPLVIENKLISNGGWVDRIGSRVFNQYREPNLSGGDAAQAGLWIDQVKRLYPDPKESEHIIAWFAHRVQRPGEKINHALVLGGDPGIGKDSILEPVKSAIGSWNFAEASPSAVMGRFNGFVKSVILRVSEARDLGEVDRFAFYEHMKTYTAAPPDVLVCDEKHAREYYVPNVTGVVYTTNHRTDGLYIPGDDRRHFVVWSEAQVADVAPDKWTEFYRWLDQGGRAHVAAYLAAYDLSKFNPKAPPFRTPAFLAMVAAGRSNEDNAMADAIEDLGEPVAVTVDDVLTTATESLREFMSDRKNSRQIGHRLASAGYVAVPNPAAKCGRWRVPTPDGKTTKRAVYVRRGLTPNAALAACSGYRFAGSGPREAQADLPGVVA